MKIEVRMAFGPGENRTVTAVVDVDPRTKLRDAEPLIHQSVINALYERTRPGDVVGDALQRRESKRPKKSAFADCRCELTFVCDLDCQCAHHRLDARVAPFEDPDHGHQVDET